MNIRKLWRLVLVIFIIQACGPSSEETAPLPRGPGPKFQSVQTDLADEIHKYELSCLSKPCHESVGMLVSQHNKMRWRCSAFFISETVMATAAHCLPKSIRYSGSKCDKRVYVLLEGQKKALGCKEILNVEHYSSKNFDYAFLKVEAPESKIFFSPIQRQGRYNKQKIKIVKVDPVENNVYQGVINETNCELNSNSMVSFYFNGPRTSQIQYSGCKTISGNSGAPIINHQNRIIGIHNSSIKPQSNLSLMLSSYTLNGRVDEFGAATNFGCLCPSGESYRRCLYYKSCNSRHENKDLLSSRQSILDRLSRDIKTWQANSLLSDTKGFNESGKFFNWSESILFEEIRSKSNKLKELKLYLSYRPTCLKNHWRFKDLPIKNNKLIFEDMPFCHIEFKLDSSLRLRPITKDQIKNCRFVESHFKLTEPNKLILAAHYKTQAHPFINSTAIQYCD